MCSDGHSFRLLGYSSCSDFNYLKLCHSHNHFWLWQADLRRQSMLHCLGVHLIDMTNHRCSKCGSDKSYMQYLRHGSEIVVLVYCLHIEYHPAGNNFNVWQKLCTYRLCKYFNTTGIHWKHSKCISCLHLKSPNLAI